MVPFLRFIGELLAGALEAGIASMGTTALALTGAVVVAITELAWKKANWSAWIEFFRVSAFILIWWGILVSYWLWREIKNINQRANFTAHITVKLPPAPDAASKQNVGRINHSEQPLFLWEGFYEIPESFAVTLGNITSEITMRDLKKWGQMIPIKTGRAVPIIVKPGKNGDVLFSFTAWAGGPVVVENNKVRISNPMIDRNFSKNALEIVDSKGQPLFQMIRENASHITIYGIFSTSQGLLCFDRDDPLEFGGHCAEGFKLTPIFRYPAWKYPGEYATTATPLRHIPTDSEVTSAARIAGSLIGSIAVIPASSADDVAPIAKQLCAFGREAKWTLMCAHSQTSLPTPPNVRGIQCYAANWNSSDAVLFELAMDVMREKCGDRIDHQFSYGGYTASGITILVGSPQ
jgi:hypothetical protein